MSGTRFAIWLCELVMIGGSHMAWADADGQHIFAARCEACHDVRATEGDRWRAAYEQKGPSLAGAGSKFKPTYLEQWLVHPRSVRNGSFPYYRWVQSTPEGDRLPKRDFDHVALNTSDAQAVAGYLGTLQIEPQRYPPVSVLPASTTRLLFDKVAACSGCHPLDAGDAPRSGPQLAGAGERLDAAWVVSYLHAPQQQGSVTMPKPFLRTEQVASLAQYVLDGLPPDLSRAADPKQPSGTTPPALDASSPRGALIYRVACSQCHGIQGDGRGINAGFLSVEPRNHRDKVMDKLSDEHLYRVIRYGGTAVDKSALMPSWGGVLTDAEIKDVIAYVRTLRQ